MSETNLQLFPGIFRSTVGGENPGFFLHSDGRVGIGNKAPTARPLWSSNDNDRNKLNVSGHTHIEGNLNVTGYLYGDGSTLSGVAAVIGGYWDLDQSNNNIKYEAGNVGIGGAASGTNKLKVHGNIEATGYVSTPYLYRSSHNSGYMVGSYNSVAPNSAQVNPIYVIGSSYMPTGDNAIGNMYGIGYSHGDFTSMLTSGWGMYVAADGDVRIGLNAQHGHIKCTGHVYCGNTMYIGGSTSRGLRSVSGNYGTVQTTGQGAGNWEGYSIDGRYVFMSSDNNSCGIYNDIDNEWMVYCERNSHTKLYYNGTNTFYTGIPNVFNNYGLRVYGSETIHDYTDPQADWFTNGGSIQAEAPITTYSLYVQYSIRAMAIAVFSDMRIKCDFMEIDDTFALEKLRQLKPTSYRYIDKTRVTVGKVLGFIAQEVAEVLPDAVSKTKSVIPNIQTEASIKKIDEEKFELTLKEPHPVTVGTMLEIKSPTVHHLDVEVVSVINDTTFTIFTKDKEIDKIGDRVWVYGEYVDDFHNLDKNAIWTVATAALQEVDRQLQAEKEKVASLEERLAALEAIVLNQ